MNQELKNKLTNNKKLYNASKLGDIGGIRSAITDGANNLDFALIHAVENNKLLSVIYLVDHGANINQYSENALHIACGKGYLKIVKYLIEKGSENLTFGLIQACRFNQLNIVKYLFSLNRLDINYNNILVLREACFNGNEDIVKFLLKNGAKSDDYCLSWARYFKYENIIESLQNDLY